MLYGLIALGGIAAVGWWLALKFHRDAVYWKADAQRLRKSLADASRALRIRESADRIPPADLDQRLRESGF